MSSSLDPPLAYLLATTSVCTSLALQMAFQNRPRFLSGLSAAVFGPSPNAAAVRACLSYACSSSAVTIMNKVVFSNVHFHYPWFTLAVQNFVSVMVISLARALRYTDAGRFSPHLVRAMPIPIFFFILFIFTNAQSLRYVNLPVLTVWKSLGPMFVTLFERLYFGDRFSLHVYFSMMLIVLSALVTAINDIEYSSIGYVWAALNVVANVAYLASLRIYLRDPDISPLDKTFHSNSLSILPILPMCFITGEAPAVFAALAAQTFQFKTAYFVSGFLTTGVCASAFWTISVTNGSTLSFVGGLNKIPIILLSLVMFDMQISAAGWVGVALGVIAGIVFVRAKTLSRLSIVEEDEKHTRKVKLEGDSEEEDEGLPLDLDKPTILRHVGSKLRLGDDYDLPITNSDSMSRISTSL